MLDAERSRPTPRGRSGEAGAKTRMRELVMEPLIRGETRREPL